MEDTHVITWGVAHAVPNSVVSVSALLPEAEGDEGMV